MIVLFQHRIRLVAALLALSSATLAHAQLQPGAPDSLAPALPVPPVSSAVQYGHQVREMSLEQAQLLLRSPAGDSWRVVSVHAPRAATRKTARSHRQIIQECKAALKFAHAHKAHAYCAALYTHSTVLLTSTGSR